MTDASHDQHRVVAVIAPGDGPHLLWPPLKAGRRRARPATRRLSLAGELAACLRMLDDEPRQFERAATHWHARWCIDRPTLTLTEAQAALTALEAIGGAARADGARALRSLCVLHGQREAADVLDRWIARREP